MKIKDMTRTYDREVYHSAPVDCAEKIQHSHPAVRLFEVSRSNDERTHSNR